MAYGNTLTPEQIASAQTPQQMAVSGANGTPTNQAITPSALTPATPIQPVTPQPQPNPTVPDFLALTQPEQQTQDQYSGISSAIASLTGELSGRDAYTTGQQQQQDIIGKQGAVSNYKNQIKALQQEQQGISLQREQNIQAKQQAMSGQGIAAPIVARHSAIDTQYNQQTLTNAIKQYSVGAQLSAAQGDLTSALNYVDQAVKLKYQPIEAQLTAQQANLQAIQNSPNFTSAQKKQAAALELQNKTYLDNLATEKENTKSVQALALQALQNGAPEPIVNKIYNSKDLGEAMGYATGYAAKETVQSIQEYNFYAKQEKAAGRTPVSYNEYQNMDANRKIAIAKASNSGLPNQTLQKVLQVAGQFDNEQVVKNYNVIKEAEQFVNSIPKTTTNPSDDQGLIYALAKVLDPNSVVREGEYATAQRYSQSLISSYGESVNQALNGTGFLSQTARENIKKTIMERAAASEKNYKNVYSEYERRINKVGGITDGKDYITDYSGGYGNQDNKSSEFDQYTNDINPVGTDQATIPRSVWSKVQNKDALLQYVQSLGRKLLVTD